MMNFITNPVFPGAPTTATTTSRTDLVRLIKAQTAAESSLESLRASARNQAELAYIQGPGIKRPRGWESLPEHNPVFKKEKKTRSAYVSRFKAKHYEELLEDRIVNVEKINRRNQHQKNILMDEEAELKAEIQRLTKLLLPVPSSSTAGTSMNSPAMSAISLAHSHSQSTDTPLATKKTTVTVSDLPPLQPFHLMGSINQFNTFPVLEFSKNSCGSLVEEWSESEYDGEVQEQAPFVTAFQ